MKNVISIILALVLAGFGYFLYLMFTQQPVTPTDTEVPQVQSAPFEDYYYITSQDELVEVSSNGEQVIVTSARDVPAELLTATIAASGARYANADESIVFWSKGNEMFIEVHGTIVHRGVLVEHGTNNRAPNIVWAQAEAGEDDLGNPRTEVMVTVNSELYNLGDSIGSCAESGLELLEDQLSSYLCWWAGFGTEYAVFAEGNMLLIKKGVVEEGSEEVEGFRGDFETLHTLAL